MLDLLPDLALKVVFENLDRPAIRSCRGVNHRLRRLIASRKRSYPMHPVSLTFVRDQPLAFTCNEFRVELKSEWTMEKKDGVFRVKLDTAWSETETEANKDIIQAFLAQKEEVYHVTSGASFFQQFVSSLLEQFDILTLIIEGATTGLLTGLSQGTRYPRQTIPNIYVSLIEPVPMELPIALMQFFVPSVLDFQSFANKDLVQCLDHPIVQSCAAFGYSYSYQHGFGFGPADFAPELFLSVKCERLDIWPRAPMTSAVLNRILKQWCEGERDFAADDAWHLRIHHEVERTLNLDHPKEIFKNISNVDRVHPSRPAYVKAEFKIVRGDGATLNIAFGSRDIWFNCSNYGYNTCERRPSCEFYAARQLGAI